MIAHIRSFASTIARPAVMNDRIRSDPPHGDIGPLIKRMPVKWEGPGYERSGPNIYPMFL